MTPANALSRTQLSRALEQIDAALSYFERALTDSSDRRELANWRSHCTQLQHDSTQSLDSSIALLGESGAGKSSLVNALLGLDLLPHDAGSAVTASVTEIRNGGPGYCIQAEIEPARSFLPRFASLCSRLRDAHADTADDHVTAARLAVDESDASALRALVGMEPSGFVKSFPEGKEAEGLLPEVREALQLGSSAATYGESSRSRLLKSVFQPHEFSEVKSRCRDYLSSRRPLWPLIRRVIIEGPFPLLRSGLRFVDLPGLNDPDPIRNRVAHDALQSARLIWLVLNAKRAMTGAVMRFLTDSRLLTRLELEGRLGSLVAIATHADQFDDSGLAQAFHLPDDVDLDTLLDCHANRVGTEVHSSLLRAWDETVALAETHVDTSTAKAGREWLRSTPFFSVSSTEFLMLRHIVRSRKQPTFESEEQTGIPRLCYWITTEFVEREQRAHSERITRQTLQLREAIRSTLAHREDIKRKLAGLGKAEKGGLKGSQVRAKDFLEERLQEHEVQTTHEIEEQAEKVRAAMDAGVAAAQDEIERHIPDRLSGIHWATLRAIARRGGVFFGSTRNWDLPAEMADVITRRVVFRWAELFEFASNRFLDDVAAKSGDLLAAHGQLLYGLIVQVIGEDAFGLDRFKQPTHQLAFELDMIRAEVAGTLRSARMSFERDLVDGLRSQLAPAFERASLERGTGMRQRMVGEICGQLSDVAPALLQALADALNSRVLEVNRILNGQIRQAHDSVRRVAGIESSNLEVALFQRTPDELLESADQIAQGLRIL